MIMQNNLYCIPGLEIRGQEVQNQLVSTSPTDLLSAGDGESHILPTVVSNQSQRDSTVTPQPTRIPSTETRK